MVLKIAAAAINAFLPSQYVVHIILSIIAILVVRAFSQGRTTNRERDLHARVVLVTGGFTPLGLTILQSLAQRGAHIIALSPHPIDSPRVSILITLLRSTTSNEQVFAEQCDLTSPTSIRSFCTRFLTGQDQRLDALIFAHEYQHNRPFEFLSQKQKQDLRDGDVKSLATFLIITLLLPALLVAPVERDIRLINVVNPFYAAAVGLPAITSFLSFSSSPSKPSSRTVFLHEGTRSLRLSILTRHLQRVLDALPSAQVPKADENTSTVPVVSKKTQKSNIAAVSVSPGISRLDTVAPLLNADWTHPSGYSSVGVIIYLILQPLLRILAKSPTAAVQSVLHVLFLPTPFKILSRAATNNTADKGKTKSTPIDDSVTEMPEEVLKPGALYAECAVVNLKISPPLFEKEEQGTEGEKGKQKGLAEEDKDGGMTIPDDGEMGGELTGRLVWEAFETALKVWEKDDQAQVEKQSTPNVDPSVLEASEADGTH